MDTDKQPPTPVMKQTIVCFTGRVQVVVGVVNTYGMSINHSMQYQVGRQFDIPWPQDCQQILC